MTLIKKKFSCKHKECLLWTFIFLLFALYQFIYDVENKGDI